MRAALWLRITKLTKYPSRLSMGKKEILLIRHGQGDHNRLVAENRIDESLALRDPALNDIGIQQADNLGVKLKEQLRKFNLELIITSPMRRTLMTTDHVFGKETSYPVIVSAIPTEMGYGESCYGSKKSQISKEFPHRDFSLIESEKWWTDLETQEHLEKRVKDFKKFLNSRPESRIAVVSHGRFLTELIGLEQCCSFGNCDCKQYSLLQDGTLTDSGGIFIRVDNFWENWQKLNDESRFQVHSVG